jgi:hypothetical protein
MAPQRNLSIRLSLQDAETVRRGLEQLGRDGQTALRSIEAGAGPASAGLLRLSEVSGRLKDSLRAAIAQAVSFRTALGTLAGTSGLGLLLRKALETSDALQDQADKLGVNVEALQELRFAAKQTGVDAEKLDQILTIFSNNVADAAKGTGAAVDALHQLGVPLKDLDGRFRPLPGLIRDIADALLKVKDPAERINLARSLFGREGASFLVTLREGSAGLDAMANRARQLGLVLSADLVKKSADAADQLEALGDSLKANLDIGLVHGFSAEFGKFTDLLNDPTLQQSARQLGENLGRLLRFIVENSTTLIRVFGAMAGGFYAGRVGGLFGAGGAAVGTAIGVGAGAMLPEIIGLQTGGAPPGPTIDQQLKALEEERDRLREEAGAVAQTIQTLQGQLDAAGAAEDRTRIQGYLDQATQRAGEILQRGEQIAAQLGELQKIAGPTGLTGTGGRADPGSVAVAKATQTQRQKSALDALLRSMAEENSLLGKTADERERAQALIKATDAAQADYDKHLRASPLLTGEEIAAINRYIDAKQRQAAVDEDAAQIQKIFDDAAKEGLAIHDEVRTAAERYAEALEHLDRLLRSGFLSQQDHDRAVKALTAEYDTAAKEITGFFDQTFDRVGSAITEAFAQGKTDVASFVGIAMALISELEQEVIKLALINPLKNWINGNSDLPTLTGVFGNLFGGGGGSSGSSGGGGLGDLLGSGVSWLASLFHAGGGVGGAASTRLVPAGAFAGAPRYHAGGWAGFAPGEVPAVLKVGERVRTAQQEAELQRRMGANGVRPIQVSTVFNFPPGSDVDSFRRSASQAAAVAASSLQRAIRRAGR